MCDFAMQQDEVKVAAANERLAEAETDFADAGDDDWKKKLQRNKNGILENSLHNIRLIMENDAYMKNIRFNQLADACETAFFKVDEEVFPAFFVFFYAFCSAYDLAIAIMINTYGDKDGNVLDLATPAAFQENVIHINIWIITTKRSGAPFLDVFVSLLVEVADRSR